MQDRAQHFPGFRESHVWAPTTVEGCSMDAFLGVVGTLLGLPERVARILGVTATFVAEQTSTVSAPIAQGSDKERSPAPRAGWVYRRGGRGTLYVIPDEGQ